MKAEIWSIKDCTMRALVFQGLYCLHAAIRACSTQPTINDDDDALILNNDFELEC